MQCYSNMDVIGIITMLLGCMQRATRAVRVVDNT